MQEKLRKLLKATRAHEPGVLTLEDIRHLAFQFELDPFVVMRVLESEGWEIDTFDPFSGLNDPSADTLDLDPEEIHRKLREEACEDELEDTGPWAYDPKTRTWIRATWD